MQSNKPHPHIRPARDVQFVGGRGALHMQRRTWYSDPFLSSNERVDGNYIEWSVDERAEHGHGLVPASIIISRKTKTARNASMFAYYHDGLWASSGSTVSHHHA